MKITNEFTVHTAIDRAWRVLTDLEGIAPCMPGARLTGVDGAVYQGRVKVKVGPVISDFAGTAQFTEKDDAAYRAVIDAKGRDARSAGNAAALVTAVLTPVGATSTKVSVDTDLKINGKLAQFGSGLIKDVSEKLLAQFVANLEAKLAAEEAAHTSVPAVTAAAGAAAAAAPASSAAPSASSSAAAAPDASSLAEPVAEGGASAAAVATAPASGVALGAVAPAVPEIDESAAAPVVPDPSAGEVEPAAGRLVMAEGTPEQIAPLNVPAGLTTESAAAAAAAARTEPVAAASTTTPAAASDGAAAPAAAAAASAPAAGASAAGASVAAVTAERQAGSEEPEPLDLLEIAGTSIYKRIVPVVVGVAAAAAVIIWAVSRP